MSRRLAIANRELVSLSTEKTIVLALLIQLFIAAFSSCLVVGLVSLYDPGGVDGFEGIETVEGQPAARIEVDDRAVVVDGRGHPNLTFESDRSAVARTSDYVDDRTVMVGADHAAAGFDRAMVESLQRGADLVLTLAVARPD